MCHSVPWIIIDKFCKRVSLLKWLYWPSLCPLNRVAGDWRFLEEFLGGNSFTKQNFFFFLQVLFLNPLQIVSQSFLPQRGLIKHLAVWWWSPFLPSYRPISPRNLFELKNVLGSAQLLGSRVSTNWKLKIKIFWLYWLARQTCQPGSAATPWMSAGED